MVEARPDAVEHRRHVLAHGGPIGAGAAQRDVAWSREQPFALAGHDLHHSARDRPLQQLDQRVDLAGTPGCDRTPSLGRQWPDLDRHIVQARACDERPDPPALDLEIDDRAVACVGTTARQTIRVVAIRLQVAAPRLSPERRGDLPTFDRDRADHPPRPLEFRDRACGPATTRRHRHVGSPPVVVVAHASHATVDRAPHVECHHRDQLFVAHLR